MVKLSIIIPTLNEGEYLQKLLKDLQNQTFKDYEIIVSDSGSTDNTKQIANQFGAKYVNGPRKGPGAGRNLGAKHAKGQILLFLDADVKFPQNWALEKLLKYFDNETIVAGSPRFRYYDGSLFLNFITWITYIIGRTATFFKKPLAPGWCIAIRKEIFNQIGGFDETIPSCEDLDICLRASKKGKFFYAPELIVEASSRRIKNNGFLKTVVRYHLLPTILFFINKKKMASKYKFVPASELKK